MNFELSLQTPALLFPALSLLILAYTNKFLSIAKLIRDLYSSHLKEPQPHILAQITSLKNRLNLIRSMQAAGLASNLFCVVTMLFIYLGHPVTAHIVFLIAIILLMISLALSIIETFQSAGALNVLLRDLEASEDPGMTRRTVKKIGSISKRFFYWMNRNRPS